MREKRAVVSHERPFGWFLAHDFFPFREVTPYRTWPSRSSHAATWNSWLMMTPLILYGYCQGIYSSRRIGRACGERVDFMAIVGMDRPDFRTVNKFRKRHLDALRGMFATLVLGTPKHCAEDDPEQDGESGSCRLQMETKRGHPAVGFRLPAITGRWYQLADYSGHWLLLVFHRHLA